MKIIDEKTLLLEKIISLEYKRNCDLEILKGALTAAYDTVNPIKFIKSTLHEVMVSPDVRQELLKKTVKFTMGYLSSKVLFGLNINPVKKIIQSVLTLIKK
jgi:hypothetical protein